MGPDGLATQSEAGRKVAERSLGGMLFREQMRRATRLHPDRPASGVALSRADCGSCRGRRRVLVRSTRGWLADLTVPFTPCSSRNAHGESAAKSSSTAALSLVASTAARSAARQRVRRAHERPETPTMPATRKRALRRTPPRRPRGVCVSGRSRAQGEARPKGWRRPAARDRRLPAAMRAPSDRLQQARVFLWKPMWTAPR